MLLVFTQSFLNCCTDGSPSRSLPFNTEQHIMSGPRHAEADSQLLTTDMCVCCAVPRTVGTSRPSARLWLIFRLSRYNRLQSPSDRQIALTDCSAERIVHEKKYEQRKGTFLQIVAVGSTIPPQPLRQGRLQLSVFPSCISNIQASWPSGVVFAAQAA